MSSGGQSMDTASMFVLGLALLVFWSLLIMMFSRPSLFKDVLARLCPCCCEPSMPPTNASPQPHHALVRHGTTGGSLKHVDCYPTEFTVPSSRTSSIRRQSSSRNSRRSAKSTHSRSPNRATTPLAPPTLLMLDTANTPPPYYTQQPSTLAAPDAYSPHLRLSSAEREALRPLPEEDETTTTTHTNATTPDTPDTMQTTLLS